MRIIGGHLGGRTLKAPAGQKTRPTSDKVREALFSILYSRGVEMVKVLDLFAGSGALGFEALSRGAGHVDFVESDRKTAQLITDNARALGLDALARVHCATVERWLGSADVSRDPYDLVFVDPPYAAAADRQGALAALPKLLAPTALVVVEQAAMDPQPAATALELVDERTYGQTRLTFWTKASKHDG